MAIEAGDAVWTISGDNSELMTALEQSTSSVESAFGTLEQHAGTLGKAFGVIGAAITGALGGTLYHWTNTGDEIQKMSLRTGISTEALSEFRHVAELGGISLSDMEVALTRMNRGLGQSGIALQEGTEKTTPMLDALKQLGIAYSDIGHLAPEDQFMMIAGALANVSDQNLQTALTMDIFGRSGTNLLPIIKAGTDAIQAQRDEAHALGIVYSQDAADAAAEFNDEMTRLKHAFEGLVIAIGPVVAELLENLIPVLQDTITRIKDWIGEHPELTKWLVTVGGVIGTVSLALSALLLALSPLIGTIKAVSAVLGAFAGVGGLGSVATAATAATEAIGTTAGAGLVGALTILGAKLALIAGAGMLLFEMFRSLQETKAATDELRDSTERLTRAEEEYMQRTGQRVEEEKRNTEALMVAWYQYYTGREASERDLAQMRNLLLNEHLSAQEAAYVASSNLSDKLKFELMTANEEVTNEILNAYGIREKAARDNVEVLTEIAIRAGYEQRDALVAAHEQAAMESQNAWSRFWDWLSGWASWWAQNSPALSWMTGGGPTPPGRQHGGPVTAGLPYMVGERGPELFIPHTSGRIDPHEGGAWRGNIEMNITVAEMNVRDDHDILRLSEMLAHQIKIELDAQGVTM